MEYKLVITQSFENDLDDVLAYISQKLLNSAAASRLLENVEEKIRVIRENSFIYPVYHDDCLAEKGYHYTVISNYLLFYTVDESEKMIFISQFLYGAKKFQIFYEQQKRKTGGTFILIFDRND